MEMSPKNIRNRCSDNVVSVEGNPLSKAIPVKVEKGNNVKDDDDDDNNNREKLCGHSNGKEEMLHKYTPKTAAFLLNIVTSLVGVIIEGREVDVYSRAIQVLSILCQFFMVGYLSWLCSVQNEWEPTYELVFFMFTGLCSILFVRWLLHTPAFYDPNEETYNRPIELLEWVQNGMPRYNLHYAFLAMVPTLAFIPVGSILGYHDYGMLGLFSLLIVEIVVYLPMSVVIVCALYIVTFHERKLLKLECALIDRDIDSEEKQEALMYKKWILELAEVEEGICEHTRFMNNYFIIPIGFLMTIMMLTHIAYIVQISNDSTSVPKRNFFAAGVASVLIHLLAAGFHFLWIIVLFVPAMLTNAASESFVEHCKMKLVEDGCLDVPRKLMLVHRLGLSKSWWRLLGVKIDGAVVARLAYVLMTISVMSIRILLQDYKVH